MSKQSSLSLFHAAAYPWQYIDAENVLHLTMGAPCKSIRSITCLACDPCDTYKGTHGEDLPLLQSHEMQKRIATSETEYFTLALPLKTHKLRYHFQVQTAEGVYLYDENGFSELKDELFIRPFFVPFTYPRDHSAVPNWCSGTIWYQIFPDRFSRENSDVNGPWNTGLLSDTDAVYGGTLQGIISKIPYLKDLGVTGIYLNPIFKAASIHRYDTIDYYTIDPGLGTEEDLIELCTRCHENGIRVMLDGVFNHCSSQSPEFEDVQQLGRASRYYDWFMIHAPEKAVGMSIPHGADAAFKRDPAYEAFAFVPSMPKYNTQNPEVMEHLIGAAEYWTKKCHIDAWRLDVPDEINTAFLREFRKRIKQINPDIYVIGEFWGNAAAWLNKELFDGAMNYPLYFVVRDFIARGAIDAFCCADLLVKRLMEQPDAKQHGMFNFCSSHDTPRILWHCQENEQRAGLCYILTAAVGNSFSIYYGDEVGLNGGYDPDNRRCFPWGRESQQGVIGDAIQDAINLVHRKKGQQIKDIYAIDEDVLCIAFETFICIINRSPREKIVHGIAVPPLNYQLAEPGISTNM